MPNAKVGKHGEIVIKKRLRKKYGIEPGQVIIEFDTGDHIAIIPLSLDPMKSLNGKYSWEKSLQNIKSNLDDLSFEEFIPR